MKKLLNLAFVIALLAPVMSFAQDDQAAGQEGMAQEGQAAGQPAADPNMQQAPATDGQAPAMQPVSNDKPMDAAPAAAPTDAAAKKKWWEFWKKDDAAQQ